MNDPDIRRFHKAAIRRLEAAEILLDNGLAQDSLYLSGYCLECSLKALILARTPQSRRREKQKERFRGGAAHTLEWLLAELHRVQSDLPGQFSAPLRFAFVHWRVELRYEVGRCDPDDVEQIITFGRELWEWVGRNL
jgi:HEPN domain-containing protein